LNVIADIFGVPWDICLDGYIEGIETFCKGGPRYLKDVHLVDINDRGVQGFETGFAAYKKKRLR